MQFECKRCGYISAAKCNLLKHLHRKIPCEPTCSDVSIDSCINELTFKQYNERTYDCIHCQKKFNSPQGKSQHLKTCKKAKEKVEEGETETHDTVINNNNNNSTINGNKNTITNNNNNININFNLTDFKHVCGDHVSSDDLVDMIKRIKSTDAYYDIFQKVLELIYFDKAHPENHSLIIPNRKDNLCQIIKDGKPQFEDRKVVTGLAVHETRNTLHDKYEENPHRYNIITQQTMTKMDNKYENNDKDHIKALERKADIAILNNKDTVMDSWKGRVPTKKRHV
jgi:hypothetical protein